MPVRWALAGTFGLIIAVTAAALILALVSGRQNTAGLVRDRSERIIDGIVERVRLHLEPARDQSSFLAWLIAEGNLDPRDERSLTTILTAALAGAAQVAAIAIIRTDLRQVRVERHGGTVIARSLDMSTVPGIQEAFELAQAAAGPAWGELVWSERLGQPLLNIRTPLWRRGSFIGLLLTTVTVGELSAFLAKSPDRLGSGAFILYGHDHVLAHATLSLASSIAKPDQPLPPVADVGDPVLASIWGPRDDVGGMEAVFGVAGSHTINVGGTRYVFLYRDFGGYSDQPWLIGTYVPLDEIGNEVRRLEVVGWIALTAVLAAMTAAWLIGHAIDRPILRLARGAEAIRNLDLKATRRMAGSWLHEIDQAIAAHNALVETALWFATYVPQGLVRRLMAQGHGATESEERMITVMFTDIVGFTSIAQRLSARETASFLNEHFALLAACIEPTDGTIDKYIGDSLMAFWGAPEPQLDQAVLACRAAVAMRAAMVADNQGRRERGLAAVRLRIGIHSGPTIVGDIGAPGRVNYTIVGDTVNTAQRIERAAAGHMAESDEVTILMSETVALATAGICRARPIGRQPFGGRRGSTLIFRLE